MTKFSRHCRLTLAVWAAMGTPHAVAQTAPLQPAGMLEEVVVTASRSRERIMDSPASLSVINEEALARASVPTLAELMRDLPGVQVTDSGQPGLGRVRIRGEASRRTAVLINGQEVTDHYEVGTPLTLHPSMVERVEVLRGSGSVLYGSRALSGVVNFITRKGGTEPLQATVTGSYDSATDGEQLFASLFGNLRGLEYRVAWSDSDYQERETPAGTMQNTAFTSETLYAYAGKGFGSHRLEYTFEDHVSSSGVYVEEEVKTTFPLTDFFVDTPQRDRRKHGVFYAWEADGAWLRDFSVNAYHQDSDREFYTYTELRLPTLGYDRDVTSTSDLFTRGAVAQWDFQPLSGHQLIAGLQYAYDEVDQRRRVETVYLSPPIPPGTELLDDSAWIETWAWFVQDRWDINDVLSMTLGLRQYFVEGELSSTNRSGFVAGPLDEDDELVAALGLVWRLNDSLHLRANMAQGYVYPSLTQLATGAYAGSDFVEPDANLTPETSLNYEIGARLQSARWMLDAAVFRSRSNDYIDNTSCTPVDNCIDPSGRRYANIGESTAQGLEVSVGYNLASYGLEPYANLTWMRRSNDYGEFTTTRSGVPAIAARAGLRWQGAAFSLNDLWSDIYLRGESSSELEEPGTVRSVLADKASWVTLNLSAGAAFGSEGQYQLDINVFNLFNETYIASSENLFGPERSMSLKLSLNL
ncbi:MAG: TonB-dependent receptor [Halioglobus sp.]